MTSIEGLDWRPNLVVNSGPRSFYVIENPGGGVTDIVFYPKVLKAAWYGVHIGQVDRLTFFGSAETKIKGYFLDCRKGSKTLHQKEEMDFIPDPRKHLFIDRGIGHVFSGLVNVTVRVESIWYMSDNNPDYDLANDTLTFRVDEDPSKYPVVEVNDLPVPDEVLQYVLSQQQAAFASGQKKGFKTRTSIDGQVKYVKAQTNPN